MQDFSMSAVQAVLNGQLAFCKFLSANDTGLTGGHQAGIYISKPAISILFDTAGEKHTNKEKWVKIRWQNSLVTDTRFIYYGKGTRNEYRITNFGRGFPYLCPEYTGALFVLIKDADTVYQAFVLNSDEEIEHFLDAFAIGPTETNQLIDVARVHSEVRERLAMERFIENLKVDFPSSEEMSRAAQKICDEVYGNSEYARSNPDQKLVDWADQEYRLFRVLEHERYSCLITSGFSSVDEFINTANQMLNRRKSRAGKSLEHHLAALFDANQLHYQPQAVTEGNKKPDFLFPSQKAYHDQNFPTQKLLFLAAKTTCKDRWRQILNEADRLRNRPKFLCTLQQGISAAQMDEMEAEGVILVVPQKYINTYPKEYRDKIWTLSRFIKFVQEVEESNG